MVVVVADSLRFCPVFLAWDKHLERIEDLLAKLPRRFSMRLVMLKPCFVSPPILLQDSCSPLSKSELLFGENFVKSLLFLALLIHHLLRLLVLGLLV